MSRSARRLGAVADGLASGRSGAEHLARIDAQLAEATAEARQLASRIEELEAVHAEAAGLPSKLEQYMLDKDGWLLLEGALTPAEVAACNGCLDEIPWDPAGGAFPPRVTRATCDAPVRSAACDRAVI